MAQENPIRILIIDNSIDVTGALKSIKEATSPITDCVFYYALASKKAESFFDASKNVRIFKFLELQKNIRVILYLPFLMINSMRLFRWISKEKIKVVHVNDMYNMTGVLLKLMKPGLLLLYHVRLLPGSYLGKMHSVFGRIISKMADHVICVSQAVFNSLPHSGKKMIIHDAIKLNLEESNLDRKKDQTVRFLYPANYIDGKGHVHALEAFEIASKKCPDMSLKFIGSDMGMMKNLNYRRSLERMVEKFNTYKIEFDDYKKNIMREILECDVVLMFSESESFSMVCLEAGLGGKPVIATRSGGPEEVIIDGETGYLVEVGNTNSMADRIRLLAGSKEKRIELGNRAKTSYRKRFSIEKSSSALNSVYQSI